MSKRMLDDPLCIGLAGCEGRSSRNNCVGASLVFVAVRFCLICFFASYIRQRLVQASYPASFFETVEVLVDGQSDESKAAEAGNCYLQE